SSLTSTRTSATTVFALSRANASALALPIPEAAPVTTAILPSNCSVISPLPGKVRLTLAVSGGERMRASRPLDCLVRRAHADFTADLPRTHAYGPASMHHAPG